LQFRYRGSRRESAVAQLFSLGGLHTLLEKTRYILAEDAQDIFETFGSSASDCRHIVLGAEFSGS
jgi:hypothetical protein